MAGLSNRFLAGIMLALVICSVLVYSSTDDHELLNWDDRSYVTNNPWVTNPNPSNLIDMFTGSRMANWHPLTWLSYAPEYALCADNASCYKFSNAVLHGLNGFLVAILVMLVVLKLGIQPAPVLEKSKRWPAMTSVTLAGVAAALLFVVHPQHVESVTWIAERKDLLCALFYFAALIAYLTASRSTYLKTYGWSFLFFVLALMSKSMAVSLPLSLMLFDVCLRRQQVTEQGVAGAIKVLFIEKLPFILIMQIAIAVTLATQSASEYAPVGFVGRLTFFVAGIEHYAISFLLPIGLSPFYPAAIAGINGLGVLTLLLFGSLLAWSLFRLGNSRIAQAVSLVLLFFLLSLVPVSGLVPIGEHAFADRYSYIPLVGFYGMAGYLWACWQQGVPRNPLPVLALLVCCTLLAVQSARYKQVWRNDLDFWSTIVEEFPTQAAMPIDNLANAHAVAGDYELAISSYRRSIAVQPSQALPYINLAGIYDFVDKSEQALAVLNEGLAINPDNTALLSRTGRALVERGELNAAQVLLERALSLNPDLPDTLLSAGMLHQRAGRLEAALQVLARVPPSMPQHYQANLHILEILMSQQSEFAEAQLMEMIEVYGATPQLEQARQLLGR
jgi:Tfp pilus assembly protein PilF